MPRKVTVANKKIAIGTKALGLKKEKLAEWTGLEPATLGVTGRYSNQLNYHSKTEEASMNNQCWRSGRDSNPRPSA